MQTTFCGSSSTGILLFYTTRNVTATFKYFKSDWVTLFPLQTAASVLNPLHASINFKLQYKGSRWTKIDVNK